MAKEPKKLDNLFHDTLKDIYYAEKKILTMLPKMAKAAQNEELKAAFKKHQAETLNKCSRQSTRSRRAKLARPSSA
jgi:ferritin-like metal-binding protein YciE